LWQLFRGLSTASNCLDEPTTRPDCQQAPGRSHVRGVYYLYTRKKHFYMGANAHGVSPKKIRKSPKKTKKRLAVKAARAEAKKK